MWKKNWIIVVVIIFLVFLNVNVYDDNEIIQEYFLRQWYLYNDGKCTQIKIDKEFCAKTNFKKNVDINVMPIWKAEKEFKNDVLVAVIDTGVDYKHEDLNHVMWKNEGEIENDGMDNDGNGFVDDIHGWNFCLDNNDLLSGQDVYENDHGTISAGIIAAEDNGIGIIGIAGNGKVKIMSVKVLQDIDHKGDIDNLIKGIKYAEMMGAQICNLSLGVGEDNMELRKVIEESSMLFIVSAGNGGKNIDKEKQYPATYNFDNVITVANMAFDGELEEKSNYGIESVDLVAPGTYMYSTCVGGYDYDTGTSMAAAVVSGVSALIYSYSSNATPQNVKSAICNSVTHYDILRGKVKYEGMVDTENALKYFKEKFG